MEELNINLKCEKFKSEIIDEINKSDLPISSVYYIFQLITKDLEETYYDTLNYELAKIQEEKNNG
jgi:hypothetical protein